jgi:dipeptidyl aminopeptidase/acylaminoacyl peptidase
MTIHSSVGVVVCALVLVHLSVQAQPGTANGTILIRQPYKLRPYDQAQGIQRYASRNEYEQVVADRAFEFERVVYSSDGLPVVAYVYAPRERIGRLPAVIFNRGSYVRGDIGFELAPLFHRLAVRGFVIIAPLYRGSDGAPGVDEMGGAEVQDLMNATVVAEGLGFVDTRNLFLYGESRGGMMTFLAIKHGFPARAAAVFGAFADLGVLIAAAPDRYNPLVKTIWSDYASRRDEILGSRSVLQWTDRIDMPLLIMHGGADRDVNAGQALALAGRLQTLGKEYELLIYAGDNHVLSEHRVERDQRAAAWFRRHELR